MLDLFNSLSFFEENLIIFKFLKKKPVRIKIYNFLLTLYLDNCM